MKIEKVVMRIKKLRLAKGYTLENMAFELDISASTYRKVEMNETKLTLERLIKISKVLSVELDEILDTTKNSTT